MELPALPVENFMPEKTMEALGVLKNSRGIFVSYDDPKKRESFLGSLGARLMDQHDVIYFSFYKKELEGLYCKLHRASFKLEY